MGEQDPGEIVSLLREFTIASHEFSEVFSKRHALHRTDLDAMTHVWIAEMTGDPMTPTRLAASLSLSAPATSALLRRLERARHVRTTTSDRDGRSRTIVLEDEARQVAVSFFTPLGRELRAVIARLSDQEQIVVRRFLADCVAATRSATNPLREQADPPPRPRSARRPQ